MIHVFKRIKSDLKEMYDLLQEPGLSEHERLIKRDMQIAQQLITDSLNKLKRIKRNITNTK